MRVDEQHCLSGGLTLERDGHAFLGGRRIALLRAIHTTGSISQAAKQIGMSYKAAWEAVDAINNLTTHPVVSRETGGRNGGGSQLTPYGENLLNLLERMERSYQEWLAGLARHIDDPRGLVQLMEQFSMQSSARNQFLGRVESILAGPVNAEVTVRISETLSVVATVTHTSVENLGLRPGGQALVLIKSSSVVLASENNGALCSARNQLCGSVILLADGPVNSEVSLDIGGGKQITAVITHASSANLDLKLGSRVCALFKASSVILARA